MDNSRGRTPSSVAFVSPKHIARDCPVRKQKQKYDCALGDLNEPVLRTDSRVVLANAQNVSEDISDEHMLFVVDTTDARTIPTSKSP